MRKSREVASGAGRSAYARCGRQRRAILPGDSAGFQVRTPAHPTRLAAIVPAGLRANPRIQWSVASAS